MGLLRQSISGAISVLETEHVIGRSPRAALQLDKVYVSAQHASVRWVDNGWEVKDLGSRNGTFVNDVLIHAGHAFRLARHDRVSFGRAEETWELADDSPPRVMVVPLDSPHEPIFADGDILPLPSHDDPKATVFHGTDGVWHLEREDEIVPLVSDQVFEVFARRFRFSCPDVVAETSTVDWPERETISLSHVRLEFRVSRDEEHVEIHADLGKERRDFGSRGHNYLLLVLARQRLADAVQDFQSTACGWTYQDELVDALRISPERLNIDIFRIRKQFASFGVSDAAGIVERRPRTKQLRIGVGSLAIQTI
jgi:FHA domain-containing protein